jgi:GNAT superfamily N-acetyltransferase
VSIRRRDDGLALRALRVGVSPQALVVHVGTDVVVRTPSRPTHRAGNVVDLLAPPSADEVPALLERVGRLMHPVGVDHLHVRFEVPHGASDAIRARASDATAALVAQGCAVRQLEVVELGQPDVPDVREVREVPEELDGSVRTGGSSRSATPAPSGGLEVRQLEGAGEHDPVAARRWYAAAVLDRYAQGDDAAAWRDWDDEQGVWERERLRQLVAQGRAQVWLAQRHGMPVATLTLLRDLDGLAVLEDLVVHPAHRRGGLATTLVATVLAAQRAVTSTRPESEEWTASQRSMPERVLVAVVPGTPAAALLARLPHTPVAEVSAALQPPTARPTAATATRRPPQER